MREEGVVPDQIAGKIGEIFQQLTKYRSGDRTGPGRGRGRSGAMDEIALPPPATAGGPGLWEVLRRRRSGRSYARTPLRLEEISQLLWAAQGVTAMEYGHLFRTAPSAGALYPVETYAVLNNVSGAVPGVYRYEVARHALMLIGEGEYGRGLAAAALGQEMAAEAGAVLAWTAVVERSRVKYRQRCYRYIYLDAGHIAQNLSLAAEGLGLGCCCIGALFDDDVNELLGADGLEETIVYMACVGRKMQ